MQPTISMPPTSQPSSIPTVQPTATPSSWPVSLDIISINALSAPITAKVVNKKVNFYLGSFVAYFVTCFLLLTLIDCSKVGKSLVKKLHDSAFASGTFTPTVSGDEAHSRVTASALLSVLLRDSKAKMVFNKLNKKDYEISKLMEDERRLQSLLAERERGKYKPSSKAYSAGFYAYIDQRRTYLGCQPLLYPDGQISGCGKSWKLQESLMEDLVVYLCNNHSVLNCIYSCDGAPVDRTGNRLIYMTQNCVAFFLSAVSGSVFNYIGVSERVNIFFDILVTTPATIAMAKVMKVLYVCPLGFSVEYQASNPLVVTIVRWLGKLVMLPILVAIGGLLVLSAIFSRGHDTVIIIVYFFLQVQLYGFFLELLFSGLMFLSTVYMRVTIDLSVRSILLLEVGRRYAEMIHRKGLLVEGKDYHYRCKYICCLLRIEYIYTFDDAVKKGYVRETDRAQGDMEMQTTSALHRSTVGDDTGNDTSSPNIYIRPSTVYEADELTTESSFQYNVAAVEIDDRVSLSRLFDSGKTTIMPKFELKSVDNKTCNTILSDEELYQEYQNDYVQASDTANGADVKYDFDEKTLSFEEWKIERKKFKAGTRGSFVKAFQVFEDREQATSSVNNTMKLANVKTNPLLFKGKL